MNPRQFLLSGGVVLLLLGIVGYAGVFSDTKSAFYLDAGENVAHTTLGVVVIAAVFLLRDASLQKWLVESPADDVLHLVVGIWALAAAFMPRGAMATTTA